MRAMTLAAWKWIAIAVLIAAVGALLLLGLGRKRGTRSYRWRLTMWTMALSLMGGIGFISLGATMSGCDEPNSSCYVTVAPETVGQDSTVEPDDAIMCYKPSDGTVVPDVQVSCYAARPPDTEVNVEPDTPIMCYEPILDVKEDGTTIQPDIGPTCYLVVMDVTDQDNAVPDVQVTCYAPLPPDWTEQDVKNDQQEEDIQIMCYDPAMPEDVK